MLEVVITREFQMKGKVYCISDVQLLYKYSEV